jgi:hypothetical protein
MIKKLLPVVLLVLLSACSNEQETNSSAQSDQSPKPLFMLSTAGVGPVNADTPFNLRKITAAFETYQLSVEQLKTFSEGEAYPVMRISDKGKVLMLINPDVKQNKVFSVMVKDNRIGNTLNHNIGQKYGDIYRYGQIEECAPGVEELSGKVLCYAPKTGNILYLFSGEWDGPDDQTPPAYVLSEWALEGMIWKPKKVINYK